ncbi:alcohol dehydrogenase catalytic domain-containing protein [Streptomyces mirabilis]
MRAVGFRVNGGVEVLETLDLPDPVPTAGQVTVRVPFAGVNFAEIQHRRGEFGTPDGPGGVDVPGLEVAGTVAALGAGVSGLEVGEPIAAYLPAFGGYLRGGGRGHTVRQVSAHRGGRGRPGRGSGTAVRLSDSLRRAQGRRRLRKGEDVLIHSAAGGVGSAAAQLARELGAARGRAD